LHLTARFIPFAFSTITDFVLVESLISFVHDLGKLFEISIWQVKIREHRVELNVSLFDILELIGA